MLREILREGGGWRGLYRGATPSVARAFLVSGSRFTAFEATHALLGGGRGGVAPQQ